MITYQLSKSLYAINAVTKAVEAYQSLAEFQVSEEEHCIRIDINNINETYKNILVDAFLNHVLFESINEHRNSN